MNLNLMKERYLKYVIINLSYGTYTCYKSHLDYVLKYFDENFITDSSEVTLDSLSNFIIFQRKNGVKNSTINKRLKPLKLMFRFNNVENLALNGQKKLKEDNTVFPVLSTKEYEVLENYLNNSNMILENILIVKLLIDTGIRLNELLNLKLKNINFVNNSIYLDVTKTKENRIVYFTNITKVYLIKYTDGLDLNDVLFNKTSSGILSLFYRIKKQCKFNEFHPHMLRHGLATKLNKNGMSLFYIQKIMGHSNVQTTQRYIHVYQEDVHLEYEKIMN